MPPAVSAITLNIENKLTDYDFRVENLSIETRVEKSQGVSSFAPGYSGGEGIKATFEVLDWKNLEISFQLSEQTRKTLGGRRIQFRIRDRLRGDSDWYAIRQTFVRIPEIEAARCTPETPGMCELTGASIDYIAQVSVDGGTKWFPENGTLPVKPTADGGKSALIPHYANKKLLLIKFRDYPQMNGIPVTNYTFVNTVKNMTKSETKLVTTEVKSTLPKNTENTAPGNSKPGKQVNSKPPQTEKATQPAINPAIPVPPPSSTPVPNYQPLNNFPGMPGATPPPKAESKSPPPAVPKLKRKPTAKTKL